MAYFRGYKIYKDKPLYTVRLGPISTKGKIKQMYFILCFKQLTDFFQMSVLLLIRLRTLENNNCNYDNVHENRLNLATPGTHDSISF